MRKTASQLLMAFVWLFAPASGAAFFQLQKPRLEGSRLLGDPYRRCPRRQLPCYIYSGTFPFPALRLSDNDDTTSFSAGSFNPFTYDAKVSLSSSSFANNLNSSTRNVVSLRKTRMQSMTNAMLNAVPDEAQLLLLLQEHKDFLLEPLEDADAVQEADSVYLGCTSRTERYRAFEQSLTDRLLTAKDPAVRQVLMTLKHFVMQFEHE